MVRSGAALRPRRARDRLLVAIWGDEAHRHSATVARRRRLTLLGVLAITAVAAFISSVYALTMPPFAPPDETPHVAYALSLAEGEIPRIDEYPEVRPVPLMRNLSVWVANHPPLSYGLLAVPLRIGQAAGDPLAGFYLARLVVVASAAAGNLLVGWLATLLLPRRPGAAVAATGVAALVPYVLHAAGIVYPDAAGFAVVTALLVTTVVVLQRGVTLARLALLTVLGMAAANMRVVGLAAAVGCMAAVAVAELLHGRGRHVRRALRGGAIATVGSVAILASSLWFYVGFNLARYDSLTGTTALMELHGREPVESTVLARLVDPVYLGGLNTHFWQWVEADTGRFLPTLMMETGRWLLGLTLLAALLVGVWRLVRRVRRPPLPLVASWAVAIGWFAVLYVAMTHFVQQGGGAHLRYLWPALGPAAVVLATGLTAPPRRWAVFASIAFVGYQAVCAAAVMAEMAFHDKIGYEPQQVALRALAADQPAVALAVLAVVALVVLTGFVWWAHAVSLLVVDGPSHLDASGRGRTVALPLADGRTGAPPLADGWRVALATVVGTAGAWLVAEQLGVAVDLPSLAGGTAAVALVVVAVARRRVPATDLRDARETDLDSAERG